MRAQLNKTLRNNLTAAGAAGPESIIDNQSAVLQAIMNHTGCYLYNKLGF